MDGSILIVLMFAVPMLICTISANVIIEQIEERKSLSAISNKIDSCVFDEDFINKVRERLVE